MPVVRVYKNARPMNLQVDADQLASVMDQSPRPSFRSQLEKSSFKFIAMLTAHSTPSHIIGLTRHEVNTLEYFDVHISPPRRLKFYADRCSGSPVYSR